MTPVFAERGTPAQIEQGLTFQPRFDADGLIPAIVTDAATWWQSYVAARRVPVLPIDASHLRRLGALPPLHKDPFDRILLSQAVHENLTLITADPRIQQYRSFVSVIW